jgi:hypothetical protein
MTEDILIANRVPGTAHIVVPFTPVSGTRISNVPYSMSRMCALGMSWAHAGCVPTVPENIMKGHRLVTNKI